LATCEAILISCYENSKHQIPNPKHKTF
jgi:hypothetical protein